MTSFSDSSSLYTSTVQSGPSANAALPPHPRLQASSAHFVTSLSASSPPPLAPGCLSTPPAFSPPLTSSRFFNGILGVSEPGALRYYTLFRLIPLTLFVFRNPTLTHLPLSDFIDPLLCDLIAPTAGLAFSL